MIHNHNYTSQDLERDFNNLIEKIFNLKKHTSSNYGLDIVETQDARILFLDMILRDFYVCKALLTIYTDAKSNEKLNERISIPYLLPKSEKEIAESNELIMINYLRLSLLNAFYFKLDIFLSNLCKSIICTDNYKQTNFTDYHKLLLSKGIISEEDEKHIKILSFIRNSLHNNGICRRIGNNEIIELKINGIEYIIKKNEVISCSSWLHILNLFSVIITSVENILIHRDVKEIPYIKDDFANTYE
jgi:hypothetical protein